MINAPQLTLNRSALAASRYPQSLLANGLQVITHTMPDRASAAVGLWVAAGGRHEPMRYSGLSHFLEHMVFKGTAHRSARAIKEAIEGVGGSLNAFTGEEFTCFLAKVPSQYLRQAITVLADMALAPRLAPHDLEKERTVIIEEIRMYRDQPSQYVYELLDRLLWPNQPLGLALSGSEATVSRINRAVMTAYQRRYYVPCNMTLVATGDVEHHVVAREAAQIYGRLSGGQPSCFAPAVVRQQRPRLEAVRRPIEQMHLCLGLHALRRRHPDRHAASLLHVVLGANMSSRLFQEVRERRGLAYDIGTHVKTYQDTGALLVSAGVEPEKLLETIRVVIAQLARCTRQLVGVKEFEQACKFYLGQTQLALEETTEHMFWLGETAATHNRLQVFEEVAQEVQRVRREDLRRVARRLFQPQRFNLSVVGPLDRSVQQRLQALLNGKGAG